MHTMTFTELDGWVAQQSPLIQAHAFFDAAEHFDDEGVQFHRGDLVVDSLVVSPVTVIDGNAVTSEIAYDYDVGLLVVTGNLTCDHIGRLAFDVVVGGSLYAKTICANTLNSYGLYVGGDIRCDVFAEFGCYTEVQGKIHCARVLSLMNEVVAKGGIDGALFQLRGTDVAQLLIPDVLTADGYCDEEKFSAYVREARSPFKT